MFIYQKFSVSETAHFVPSEFPQLEATIHQLVKRLANEPIIKIEMVLSFVKDHCIQSAQVKDHPGLASLISGQTLPLELLEALFEAGKNNSVFRNQLEDHIRSLFLTPNPDKGFDHSALLS